MISSFVGSTIRSKLFHSATILSHSSPVNFGDFVCASFSVFGTVVIVPLHVHTNGVRIHPSNDAKRVSLPIYSDFLEQQVNVISFGCV